MKSIKLTLSALVTLAFLIATLTPKVNAATFKAPNYDDEFDTDDDGDVIMTDAYDGDDTAGNGPAGKDDVGGDDDDDDDDEREHLKKLIMKSSAGGPAATKVVDNQKIGGEDKSAKVSKETKDGGDKDGKDKKDDSDDQDVKGDDKDNEAGAGGKD